MTIVRKVRDGKFHSRIILNSHNVRVSEILAENVRGLPLDGFVTLEPFIRALSQKLITPRREHINYSFIVCEADL